MKDQPTHEDLPLPDYDHVPLGTLPSRIHGLDQSALEVLLTYERGHGNRLPIIQVLESRLGALKSGAQPSGAVPEEMPEVTSSQKESPVSPATSGPPINPPSQGVPTNPSQPR